MSREHKQNKGSVALLSSSLLLGAPSIAIAGDINFNSKIDSTAYVYETKRSPGTTYEGNEALVVSPSLLSTFTSKGLTAYILAEHTAVEQSNDEVGADKNYTEFQYNSNFTLIPNSMNLAINGARNYRVTNQLNSGFGDKVLSPGDLTLYETNGVNFNFTIPNPKYIGLSLQGAYSESDSEDTFDTDTGIETKNSTSAINIYHGHRVRGLTFNLSGQNSTSKRSSYRDFDSTSLSGSLGLTIANNIDMVLVGTIDKYNIDSSVEYSLDTNTYGAGFEWNPRSGRQIRLTYNQIEEYSRKHQFLGFNSNWSFSSRTSASLDISKKFYGDAYKFSLTQKLKNFRMSMNYNEEVTSYSNLGIVTTPQLFVCSIGATELADCFQPDSTDYVLEAGEGFLTVDQFETSITEEVFLRKGGSVNLGYQKRKVKLSANASYGKTEYLESDRESANRRLDVKFSYQLGKRTNWGLSTYISRRAGNNSDKADTIKSIQANFKRDLTQKMDLDIALKIIDRESIDESRDVTDRRLTVGLNYTF